MKYDISKDIEIDDLESKKLKKIVKYDHDFYPPW